MSLIRRRESTSFNLSFLDVMSCGFGAVVLLVLIVNAHTVSRRTERYRDMRAQVMLAEKEVWAARRHLLELKSSLEEKQARLKAVIGQEDKLVSEIILLRQELKKLEETSFAQRAHLKALETDLRTLDQRHRRLSSKIKAEMTQGENIRRFEGEGYRQYLTGFKLGGRRVAILVDTSASMLDSSVVGVIVRRNLGVAAKIASPKWQQAKRTVDWIVANLPRDSSFQIITFNVNAVFLSPSGKWIPSSDSTKVSRIMDRFHQVVPSDGTSLEKAFDAVRSIHPEPDNIILITDGLPTQGKKRPDSYTVSGERRVELFKQAIGKIPSLVPVNTILLSMEGDPVASALYWKLAVDTSGSFFTPAQDWP